MSEPNKYREWILETIDSLRSRKARPDLERICRMVRRRHGSDPDRTRTELEKLIQEQTVLKVSYKGSISYRNAAKVQRKSRKKSEFTAAGSSGAEAARERTKHDHPNNNGDSAHSFTDQEEGEEDSEPSPDPHTHTSASATGKKLKPASSPSSGNECLSCGATTGCDVGSGCKEEKASAPRDKGLEPQGAGDCPSPGHRTSAHDGGDAGRTTPSKADAVREGKEPGLSGADTQNKTCSGSVGNLPQQQKQKQAEPLKPKLRVAGGGTKTAGNHANPDLGDRLVASVRSLSERSLRGGSAAATRGHMKPLGLKEILGYLSSQERLSEEKLTRGKVKVVMEREVARGRLRRTRCGNITLPLRGMVMEEPVPKNASADRLMKSALQDKHTVKKPPFPSPQESEPMETASEEEEREENREEEEEEEEDPRSSDEEGGLSPVAMTTEPELIEKSKEDAEIQTASEQPHEGKGTSGLDLLSMTSCPPVRRASPSQSNSAHSEEERAVVPDQLRTEIQSQMQRDRINHNSSGVNSLESKTEVGVSSCLLTPTASPRDSGVSEERGINGGVSSGGFIKSEGASGSPVDWTVSDVVSYFTAAGFPEQAAAFRTQEIDGKSLLLMQRNDVLTGLSIRLGPALKIYERHVKVLQKTHFEEDDC
ncbi:sterile alpha motif domain-containing protein 1 [Chaetodon auriga]|uniref:sterile alpha motif domain-containing protein 1 n=1 Tax=Chaetodon auriga TaxID=39042 RepID=UPI004032A783